MHILPNLAILAGQLTLVTLPMATEPASYEIMLDWLSWNNVGNVLLRESHFGQGNMEEKALMVNQCARILYEKIGIVPYIGADQEGGRVQAMKASLIPPPMDIPDDELQHYATLLARESARVGINLILGPVLDIPCDGNFIGNRAFARDPDSVVKRAQIWIQALKTQSLLVTGKHFPGHGSTTSDTHKEAARVDLEAKHLHDWELKPFYTLQHNLDAIMSAHVLYPSLDPHNIATYSKAIMTEKLSEFEGLRISDSLGMRAATPEQLDFEQTARSMAENAVKAINAGCDLVIIGRPHYECDIPKLEVHMNFVDRVLGYITEAIKNNKIPEERLLDAYTRNQNAKRKILPPA